MRLLFLWSAAEFSTFDVARGYRDALIRAGHEVHDFRLYNHLKYHADELSRLDPPLNEDIGLVTRMACETMVSEALRYDVELVTGVCGMGINPDGLNLLNKAGFPIGLLFTESPYMDEDQAKLVRYIGHPFTNERRSAERHGWGYLPAAYDPIRHRPRHPTERSCDVLVVGTGWPERQELLEGVDWTGIRLRILGFWRGIKKGTKLWPYYTEGPVDNDRAVRLYASAKVCVNQHRGATDAYSLNPRAYELAACGALQVSDVRPELIEVFGMTVPLYRDSTELELQIRDILGWPASKRRELATQQRAQLLAGKHTFDHRAAAMMTAITGGSDGEDPRTERAGIPAGRRRQRPAVLKRS